MRVFFLLALLPVLALAQGRPPSSGGGTACGLASSSLAFASYFRATSVTNTVPGFQCDGVLDKCIKFGPGADTHCGTNVAGEVVCGRSGGSGVWRFYGTSYFSSINVQNVTATNVVTVPFLLQTSTGYAENQNTNKPWRVNDAEGFQNTCKSALPTCGTVPEATEVAVCGTAGAYTKRCFCTYDGTTYAWRNTLNPSAGAGTATTCPAT